MQKMVTFRLSRECRDISVNVDKILYVSHYEHGASSLHFGKDCFLRVQGELADVVRKIEIAMTDAPSTAPRDHADHVGFN